MNELTSEQKRLILENKETVEKILNYEETKQEHYDKNNWRMVWDYGDVGCDYRPLHKLYACGVLHLPFGASGKLKNYALKDRRGVKEFLIETNGKTTEIEITKNEKITDELPDDLFNIVSGYSDIKKIFLLSLKSDKPVHILLEGPPASAKSLFLMEIERLGKASVILAGLATSAGIRDVLIDTPEHTIIDEIDKVKDSQDLSSLLSWMESGRIIITKNNNHTEIKGKGWVFAACNT
ncbi:hypothetical protein LCGC14_2752900, partial [marine sediment metagenome]